MNEKNWIGHGYFWKLGSGEMCKDLGSMDYDYLEDNFYHLKQAKVLVADYSILKRDFPILINKSNHEINAWLIEQSAYLSEGQKTRMSPDGDMHPLLDISNLEDFLDLKK